ncbi:MAG: DMT family transporter [Gallionella sp.]
MQTTKNLMPIAGVLSGALVWGLIWYPFRILQQAGVSGALATLLVFGIALLASLVWLPRVWREFSAMQNGHLVAWLALLVFSTGAANFGYVLAMLHGDVMRVLLLFYLAPLWTILLSASLLNESLNRYGYLVIVLSVGGAVVMLWNPQHGLPLPQNLSEWIALAAGFSFALSNVVSRRAQHVSLEAKTFSVAFGTVVLTLPLIIWQGGVVQQLAGLSVENYAVLLILGGVLAAVAYAVQYGVTHLPANQSMLLFLFELVVAAASSYVLVGAAMSLRDWIGAVLIVSASLWSGKIHA